MKNRLIFFGFLAFSLSLFAFPVVAEADVDQNCSTRGIQYTKRTYGTWPQYACSPNEMIKGIMCYQPYCGQVHLICCDFTKRNVNLLGPPKPTVRYWSKWFSEEAPDNMTADVRGFLRAIQCRGTSCDQKSVEFLSLPDIRNTGQCYWSRYFSEEKPNNFYECGPSEFVAGVRCRGDYCDDLSLYCCRGEMQPTSTAGGQPGEKKTPGVAPLMRQLKKQQPSGLTSLASPLGDVAGSRFALTYVDATQGNRFDAIMEFTSNLKGARWRYSSVQGNWHPLRVTATSGSGMSLQGEYIESGTRVRETYNLSFGGDHRQVSGNATLVFSSPDGSVMQRNYQISGTRR